MDKKAKEISRRLAAWYHKAKRDLPWRNTSDPYSILVSEVMLQQTTVSVVEPYYLRFLGAFPDVSALARAHEEDVLRLWSGLGYYRRARLLHAAAKSIVAQHDGRVPDNVTTLRGLPGVGRYTAGAVASFGYGKAAPIVEANSARVLTRLHAYRGALKGSKTKQALWDFAEELLPSDNAREHNYALMELGSLICVPVKPLCESCPIAFACAAHVNNLTDSIPPASPKPAKISVHFAGVVTERDGRYLVRRIPEGEWHHGLYEFPKITISAKTSCKKAREMLGDLVHLYGSCIDPAPCMSIKYTVTHHRVTLQVWRAYVKTADVVCDYPDILSWVSAEKLRKLPFGSAQKKIVKLITGRLDSLNTES
ncbi:MAG: A/G-specific adenine glycosylase [bacterium]|nr:A/G-specific adenine glycosylase [Candidatus Sumerlaeota bacterium]